jgi:hypothetical protein
MAMAGVPITVSARTRASVERAFDAIVPIDLPRIFTGFGPLPAVAGVRDQTGDWDHVGAGRIVELAGGREAPERITAYDRPAHFAYRVGPFTGTLGWFVREADGAWWFSPDVSGTEIRWNYTFRPRPHAAALVRIFIAPLWRRYARRALGLAVGIAEDEPSAVLR